MSSTDARANMPHLPTEMWLEVLQYLGLDDLKILRQSCHQFYDLCNRIYSENWEIVFYGNINTNAKIISLADVEYTARHLKFVDVHLLDDSILAFFHTHGSNVRSLVFRDCKLVSGLLRNIILCCENLRTFHFEVDCSMRGQQEGVNSIFKDFNTLQKKGIIRQHVSSFTFRLSTVTFVINESFSNFFTVFPNIKELNLACDAMVEDTERSNVGPSLSFIYDQLFKMRHRLEKLSFHLRATSSDPSNSSVTSWSTISSIEMEKLKELSLNWHDIHYPPIMAYTGILEHLTEFKCITAHELEQDISAGAFIQSLLNSATKLRSLTILKYDDDNGYPDMNLDRDCFQALVRSRLRALNIGIFSKTDVTDDSLESTLQPNNFLRNLKLGNLLPCKWNPLLLLFTKYFQCLEIIDCVYEKVSVLENILRYQKNLRNLSLRNYSSQCTTFLKWLTRMDRLSVSPRFDNLTRLSLVESSRSNLCELFLTKFEFPKLQSLSISVEKKYLLRVNGSVIQFIFFSIRKLAELEYLEIHWQIETGALPLLLLDLHVYLPKLRYLIYSSKYYTPFPLSVYHRTFDECPALRIFIHEFGENIYHRCVKYFNPDGKIDIEVLPFDSRPLLTFSSLPPKVFYKGIPQKYLPYYWNNILVNLV